jgi:hypothetical protein
MANCTGTRSGENVNNESQKTFADFTDCADFQNPGSSTDERKKAQVDIGLGL